MTILIVISYAVTSNRKRRNKASALETKLHVYTCLVFFAFHLSFVTHIKETLMCY